MERSWGHGRTVVYDSELPPSLTYAYLSHGPEWSLEDQEEAARLKEAVVGFVVETAKTGIALMAQGLDVASRLYNGTYGF